MTHRANEGRVSISFETALPEPYHKNFPGPLSPQIVGPTRLAEAFDRALRRSARRKRERERALEWRRPRPRRYDGPLADDDPTPKGWHRIGACPDCMFTRGGNHHG